MINLKKTNNAFPIDEHIIGGMLIENWLYIGKLFHYWVLQEQSLNQ